VLETPLTAADVQLTRARSVFF